MDRINAFHEETARLWPVDPSNIGLEQMQDEDLGGEGADEVFSSSSSPLHSPGSVEHAMLLLPSNIGLDACAELGFMHHANAEKRLRVGQLNDTLQNIRIGLSRKVVIFRDGLRNSKTKTMKMRSWDQIIQVDGSVKHHARVYKRARAAFIRLGATDDDLNRYKPLAKEDLNVTTARIDPSLRGQRNQGLAWFWTMDVSGDAAEINGMLECKHLPLTRFHRLTLQSLSSALAQGQGPTGSMGRRKTDDTLRDGMGAPVFPINGRGMVAIGSRCPRKPGARRAGRLRFKIGGHVERPSCRSPVAIRGSQAQSGRAVDSLRG